METTRFAAYMPGMTDSTDWAAATEARLLDAAIPLIPELGWNARVVRRAGEAVGLSAAETELLLPGGARDLAALFSYRQDETALTALASLDATSLKIRERIARGVQARVELSRVARITRLE